MSNNTIVGAEIGTAHYAGWNLRLHDNAFVDVATAHHLHRNSYGWYPDDWPGVVGEWVYADLTADHPYYPFMPQALKDAFLEVNPDSAQLRRMHDGDAERMRNFADVPDDQLRIGAGADQGHDPVLQLGTVAGKILVHDYQVGGQALHAPVGMRLQRLPDQVDAIDVADLQQHDRQIAGNGEAPKAGLPKPVARNDFG